MYFPLSVGARTVLNPERTNVQHVNRDGGAPPATFSSPVPTFMPRSCGKWSGQATAQIFSGQRFTADTHIEIERKICAVAWPLHFPQDRA